MEEQLLRRKLRSIADREFRYSFNEVIEEIYDSIYEDCFKLSYKLTSSLQESKDLIQDVFVYFLTRDKAKIALQIISSNGTIKGYFCQAIINRFRNNIRNKVINIEVPIDLQDSTQIDPYSYLFLQTNIEESLSKLTKKERMVFCLKIIEGWTHKTIHEMGYADSLSDSKQVLYRARIKLISMLKDYHYIKK